MTRPRCMQKGRFTRKGLGSNADRFREKEKEQTMYDGKSTFIRLYLPGFPSLFFEKLEIMYEVCELSA